RTPSVSPEFKIIGGPVSSNSIYATTPLQTSLSVRTQQKQSRKQNKNRLSSTNHVKTMPPWGQDE
ncbi:hypothetical protein ACQCP0_25190, partial [Ralstonia pseudosolanacearum]|uniref:hypothetical protein n=1 Tax=Ralstonia pseudosolanacearum TaxID=1310165 RepID=UPI003CF0C390